MAASAERRFSSVRIEGLDRNIMHGKLLQGSEFALGLVKVLELGSIRGDYRRDVIDMLLGEIVELGRLSCK